MRTERIQKVLTEWKEESKITHLILYSLRNGILTIYTDRPGPMIGMQGRLVYKYTDKLKETPYVKEVKIIETDGIF